MIKEISEHQTSLNGLPARLDFKKEQDLLKIIEELNVITAHLSRIDDVELLNNF